MAFGSVRHHVHIHRDADTVWALAGDPSRLAAWFPGITACTVEGSTRTITLGTGMVLPEEILVCDPGRRRFQYRIASPLFSFHRGTIDVLDVGDGTTVVSYATDADPRTMALTIGGGTAGALDELKRQMEGDA
jgi:carbon monoxide dehydrogenase subunit G